MVNTRLLLSVTFLVVCGVYYWLFSFDEIKKIVLDEYILLSIDFSLILGYFWLKFKLKDKQLYEFIPNTNYVPLKSTILFFIIFEIVDFYSEDGLIGMIKLWFMYWLFGILTYFLTHIINLYYNHKTFR